MSAEAYLDYSLKEFWLFERQPKGLGWGRRRERCSQVSPPFVRTGVAKGLMGAGELSRAFSFLKKLPGNLLQRCQLDMQGVDLRAETCTGFTSLVI